MLALAFGCGDSIHTVGRIAPQKARDNPAAGMTAGSGGAGRNGGVTAGTIAVEPGDVGLADGGTTALPDAILPMLGEPSFSCRGTSTPALRRQLDLYLMIDTNLFAAIGTGIEQTLMASIDNLWVEIREGLSSYVDDERAAGTGVGVGYFPAPVAVPGLTISCNKASYVAPTVTPGLLPGNADEIKRSIPLVPLGLGSPTLPALQGAIAYGKSRANGMEAKQSIVLITDRIADFACLPNEQDIVDAAHDAFNDVPTVPVYVIALTSPGVERLLEGLLSNFVRFEQLDQVAAEGGTRTVREVDLDDQDDSFSRALLDVQHDAEPCQYAVGADVAADPSRNALGTAATPGADPLPLPRVAAVGDCGAGYYLDDPAAPKWATLCRDTCIAVKSSGRSVVWIDECDVP